MIILNFNTNERKLILFDVNCEEKLFEYSLNFPPEYSIDGLAVEYDAYRLTHSIFRQYHHAMEMEFWRRELFFG